MGQLVRRLGKSILRVVYKCGLNVGLFILPAHYYVPIANPKRLRKTREHWANRSEMRGVTMDATAQVNFLESSVAPFLSEYRNNAFYRTATSGAFGPGYGPVEAQALHGMLRWLKPNRIIEVGSGASTYCMIEALKLNKAEGADGSIVCIEPYPSEFLKYSKDITLHSRPVEQLDPAFFDQLNEGDFLFIDSTHAIKPGGDVLFLYLAVLPRLKPGVIVHIHDIYLPYLYQRDLLDSLFQWEETALLLALLTNNERLSVLLSLSLLHYDAPNALKEIFPGYIEQLAKDGLVEGAPSGHFPSSIYLKTM